jgi:hypothetical protein
MKEYQVMHTLKRIGDTPYSSIEMCGEKRKDVS